MKEDTSGQVLIEAIQSRDIEQVCSLLDSGFSPDTTDTNHIPGLIIAAELGYAEIVEILLAAEADWSSLLMQGSSKHISKWGGFQEAGTAATWVAATAGHRAVIQMLHSVMPRWWFGFVCARACEQGNLNALHSLVEAVRDISVYQDCGLLQAASRAGHLHIAQYLIDVGVDVDAYSDDRDEDPALIVAASNGRLDIVKLLVAAGASVNNWIKGETPLLSAAYAGQVEVYNYLYPLASEEIRKLASESCQLSKALKRKEREQRTDIESFIFEGAMLGRMEVVQWGIRRGLDINAIGSRNQTALMYAAAHGTMPIVKALIEAGANPNIQSDEEGFNAGTTALMKAASSYTCHFAENADAMIRILVAAGADVNLQDEAGRTALVHAVTWPYRGVALQAIQALIEAGSDPNLRDNEGNTALTYAQNQHHLHIDYAKVVDQLKVTGAFE